jgi:integrase
MAVITDPQRVGALLRAIKDYKGMSTMHAAHVVPLSRQVVAVLRDLRPLTGHGRYVFPSPRAGERPMSDHRVFSALRRMEFPKDKMTGHGFRALVRTLLAE